jgi:hypothetical protein
MKTVGVNFAGQATQNMAASEVAGVFAAANTFCWDES